VKSDILELNIDDNDAAQRYEARTGDGALAGFAEYRRRPSRIVFTHTVTQPGFEGRGVASTLIRFALDDARRRTLRVTPVCPFVRAFIERNDDYQDLLAAPLTEGV
jgi:uncharacterized protein